MGKQDVVAAAKSSLLQAQDQSLTDFGGACYDGGAADQKAADGSSTSPSDQATIDQMNGQIASLTQQLSDSQAKDAADVQALADAQAKFQSDMDATNKALADMTAKEQLEEQAVADVAAKIASVQASFDAIKALFSPAPAPEPQQG